MGHSCLKRMDLQFISTRWGAQGTMNFFLRQMLSWLPMNMAIILIWILLIALKNRVHLCFAMQIHYQFARGAVSPYNCAFSQRRPALAHRSLEWHSCKAKKYTTLSVVSSDTQNSFLDETVVPGTKYAYRMIIQAKRKTSQTTKQINVVVP